MASKNQFFVTPAGKSVWPYVLTPDTEHDPDGVYHARLQFFGDDARFVREKLDSLLADAVTQMRLDPRNKNYKVADAPYTVLPDGGIQIKAKQKAIITNRSTRQQFQVTPKVFDHNKQPWDKSLPIRNGSILALNIEIVPYANGTKGIGIQLRLKDVLVVSAATEEKFNPFSAFDTGSAPVDEGFNDEADF